LVIAVFATRVNLEITYFANFIAIARPDSPDLTDYASLIIFLHHVYYILSNSNFKPSLWAGKRNYEKTTTTNGAAAFHV